jgi:MFS family permease
VASARHVGLEIEISNRTNAAPFGRVSVAGRSGLLLSACWFTGMLSDRYGRVRMLTLLRYSLRITSPIKTDPAARSPPKPIPVARRTNNFAKFCVKPLKKVKIAKTSMVICTTTIKTVVLTTEVQGGYYAVATWLPTYLKTTQQLSVFDTGTYLFVIIVGAFIGFIIAAYLADYLG